MLTYINPSTGLPALSSQQVTPALDTTVNAGLEYPDFSEQFLQASVTVNSTTLRARQNITPEYINLVSGGEFVPHAILQGKETLLTADLAIDGTSMTVETATTTMRGVSENIFVANRPYLLMNRKPLPGEDIWATGTDANGLLRPAAEIIFVGAGYTSGTTVTIVRGTGAAVRKRFAVVQALTAAPASYSADGAKGVLTELERPNVVTVGAVTDNGTQTIKAQWLPLSQQADNSTSSGVVTHYAVFVVPAAGAFQFGVKSLPENCPPSALGGSPAVFRLDSADLDQVTVGGVVYNQVAGLNKYWDGADSALKTITAGNYWVGIAAMNQGTFTPSLRMSLSKFKSVTVA